MKATVQWKEKLAFEGIASTTGFPVQMDSASLAEGGSGASPMELIALGLAGCTAMDVISILQKKQQKVTSFHVDVDAARAPEPPKVYTSAVLTYIVTGSNVDESALLRAIELSVTKYCPVHAMLSQVFPIDVRYEIYEEENGEKRLTYQGIWQELPQE
ncbi:MAG: OsmC family protein [Anaerolineales bacterium]